MRLVGADVKEAKLSSGCRRKTAGVVYLRRHW
jgi:hypothetical protein